MLVGVPISLLAMGVVVGAQVLLQWVKWKVGDSNDEKT